MTDVNVAVIRGIVSSPAEIRELPDGTTLAQLQVTTRLDDETLSLPVAAWNPAPWVKVLKLGAEIVVLGRVRRRFFRAGGATASRVEVEAVLIFTPTSRKSIAKAIKLALREIEGLG